MNHIVIMHDCVLAIQISVGAKHSSSRNKIQCTVQAQNETPVVWLWQLCHRLTYLLIDTLVELIVPEFHRVAVCLVIFFVKLNGVVFYAPAAELRNVAWRFQEFVF